MSRPVNWSRDYVIKACDTWYDMRRCEQARWTLVFLSMCSRSQRWRKILYRIFFHRLQTIFDRIKTELSVATETINQTRPWSALALLIYGSSRDRLTAGQIAQSLSSQIPLEIRGKRSIESVHKPRNGKLCKYCLLYSSGEILESIARSLFHANDKWRHHRKCQCLCWVQ